jgi:hypothetical protein
MKPFARCLLAIVVLFAAALAVPLAASADAAPSSSEVAAAFPSVVEAAAPELDWCHPSAIGSSCSRRM